MMKVALVLLLVVSTIASAARTLPKPKPINQDEVYYKEQHSLCGPFLDMLPKKSADRLRRILEQEDSTKGEIDDEVERWVAGQDSDVQEKYTEFKRTLKVRLLRLKLKHELRMKTVSDAAKKLDEELQDVIDDRSLTWKETAKAKAELVRKASPKVLKELGINPDLLAASTEQEPSKEEDHEDPPKEGYDYEHNNGGGKFDYHQNDGGEKVDYHQNDGGEKGDYQHGDDYNNNEHFGNTDNEHGMRKNNRPKMAQRTRGRARPEHLSDYGDYN